MSKATILYKKKTPKLQYGASTGAFNLNKFNTTLKTLNQSVDPLKDVNIKANAFKNVYGSGLNNKINPVDTATNWKPDAPQLVSGSQGLGSNLTDYSKLLKQNTEKTVKGMDTAGTEIKDVLDSSGKSKMGSFMGSAGGQAAVQGVAMIGGAIAAGMDDGRAETYTGKEMGADIGNSMLQGAAAGAMFGPWGAAAGAVIGGATALIGAKKKKKEAKKAQFRLDNNALTQRNSMRRNEIMTNNSQTSANASNILGFDIYNKPGGYGIAKRGGIISPSTLLIVKTLYKRKKKGPVFKKGGKLSHGTNVIPNGVTHEEKNSLGDKGLPVVKCDEKVCVKEYEIEKEELILALDTSEKVDKLVKEKKHKQLGTFLTAQLFNNTHSFSDKYIEFNKLAG